MVSVAARSFLVATAVATLGASTAACSSEVCPAVLQFSGVGIKFPAHLLPRIGTVTLRVCVDAECGHATYSLGSTRTARTSPTPHQLWVRTSPLPRDADVTVSVSIAVPSRVVFSGTTHTHTTKPELDIPSCGLDHWGVAVTAHRDGRLT
jgi:hypothetical protein